MMDYRLWALVLGMVPLLSAQKSTKNMTDKEVLDYLLDPERYDNRVRPESKTVVNVTVLLLTLSSPDESSLSYEVEFLLEQRWKDHRLVHEQHANGKTLNALYHVKDIWLPDTYFIKHGEFKYPLDPLHMSIRVSADGTVSYIMRRSMRIVCQGNLEIFPFDNPKCPFALESISHEESELELTWAPSDLTPTRQELEKSESVRAHNAYLADKKTEKCDTKHTWRGNYSCLTVLLVFTRDKSFYFSTVFVPGMVLVASSFISFWLDVNAVPARVMLGVTTMLNFCTTTNSFRSNLPVVSNLTAMNMWDGVCMFFIYASMLEFIVVNYLYRQPPHGRRPSDLLPKSPGQGHNAEKEGGAGEGVFSPRERPPTETRDTSDGTGPGTARTFSLLTWIRRPILMNPHRSRQQLSRKIDNISKVVFPSLFGMFVFCFFLIFAVIKPKMRENWELLNSNVEGT